MSRVASNMPLSSIVKVHESKIIKAHNPKSMKIIRVL